MKTNLRIALGLLLALAAAPAGAVSIGLSPSPVNASVGVGFELDVVVSGLGGADSSISAYDLDIAFDSSLLSFDSVEFGVLLGGPADSLQDSGLLGAGVLDLAELSLLGPGDLDALQPDSFVLATLRFTPLATGTSSVTFGPAIVANGAGGGVEVQLGAARVVTGERVIPEPGAAALFALGALAVARRARRR